MDSVFQSNVSGTPPAAPEVPLIGHPRAGDPVSGTKATRPGPWWYYLITQELRNIVVAAGLTPDGTDTSQLLEALQTLFMPVGGVVRVWQDYTGTGTRAANTIYLNDTGYEIDVAIRGFRTSGDGRLIEVSPNGVAGWIVVGGVGQTDDGENTCFAVPDGWSYRINGTGVSATDFFWAELRRVEV